MVEENSAKVSKDAASDGKNEPRYDKYYDATYQMPYYFDKETNESIWVLPDGVDEAKDVKDCTK